MPEALIRRPPAPLALLRARMHRSDAQVRAAALQLRNAVNALTPAARFSARPMQWVLAAFAAGLALALLTSPRRRGPGGARS
jgi:hypothetical protein